MCGRLFGCDGEAFGGGVRGRIMRNDNLFYSFFVVVVVFFCVF